MANPVCEVLLTDAPIQAPPGAPYGSGGVVDFLGVVRPLEDGREISGISYEAHETMASHQMEQIARDAIRQFNLDGAIVYHRLGFVPAGEASVFVRTTSRNRAEAYRANQCMMDELKKRVPIWKRPEFVAAPSASRHKTESVSSR